MKKPGRKLKVFRTGAGFYDAYVAAPTQKAAIEAWGADPRTFARGDAEVVTDPALIAEALAKPGEVIRKKRGELAEQLAALGPARKPKAPREQPEPMPAAKPARAAAAARPKPRPRPRRDALERAEAAMRAFEAESRESLAALRAREAALAKERRELEQRQEAARAKLARALEAEQAKYEQAMDRWRETTG